MNSRQLYKRYLDPKIVDRIAQIELRARQIVEGFMMGLNKSPIRGFSVEFKQHREYVHGDDLRHLDWKVFARTDRFYIREFEQETNARVHLVLDASKSMKYKSSDRSKFDVASLAVASLAYLALTQRDSVSFTLFTKGIERHLAGSTSHAHLAAIYSQLAECVPDGETDFSTTLRYLSEKIPSRGIVIIVSDFFDDPERIRTGLRLLRVKRHDIIVMHLLDEYELTFPFKQLTRFDGIEELERLMTDPRAIRDAYLSALERFNVELQRECLNDRIDYLRIGTHEKLDAVLAAYLAKRQKAT